MFDKTVTFRCGHQVTYDRLNFEVKLKDVYRRHGLPPEDWDETTTQFWRKTRYRLCQECLTKSEFFIPTKPTKSKKPIKSSLLEEISPIQEEKSIFFSFLVAFIISIPCMYGCGEFVNFCQRENYNATVPSMTCFFFVLILVISLFGMVQSVGTIGSIIVATKVKYELAWNRLIKNHNRRIRKIYSSIVSSKSSTLPHRNENKMNIVFDIDEQAEKEKKRTEKIVNEFRDLNLLD